jgi:hypothetical protein
MNKQEKIAAFNPNSAGLKDANIYGLPFSNEECDIVLIPVPWDATTSYRPGTARGPQAIFEASKQVDLPNSLAAQSTLTPSPMPSTATPRPAKRRILCRRSAVSFMMRSKMLNAEQFEEARQILRDIDSLDSHTEFLFEKINFLMDATVGFININQNKIIKIFSVASVALLPPTLIASLYGMNFQYMPELSQTWGYPYALALMVASAVVPMWYFRRRGWLK